MARGLAMITLKFQKGPWAKTPGGRHPPLPTRPRSKAEGNRSSDEVGNARLGFAETRSPPILGGSLPIAILTFEPYLGLK